MKAAGMTSLGSCTGVVLRKNLQPVRMGMQRQQGVCVRSSSVPARSLSDIKALPNNLPTDSLSAATFTSPLPSISDSGLAPSCSSDVPEHVSRDTSAQASTSGVPGLGGANSLWDKYNRSIETNPVVTKAFTSFFGFLIGDCVAQTISPSVGMDVFRMLRMASYGLILDGPVGHFWYKVLDRYVMPDKPTSTPAVLIKTAADQLIWAPIMTCVFFAFLKLTEGHVDAVIPCIQAMVLKTLIANYVVWPFAHFVNFRFVPSEHRILYNNAIAIAWNCYLSSLSHTTSLDTQQLLCVIHNAQDLLDQLVLVPQDPYSAAWTQAGSVLKSFSTLSSEEMVGAATNALQNLPKAVQTMPLR